MKKAVVITLIGVAIVGIVVAVTLYSGAYNVAATTGHSKIVEGALHTLMVRSVRAHARTVTIPSGINVSDPAFAARAISGYEAMCRTCHGAPGRKADPWEFYPAAPELTKSVREHGWSDAEIFWIIKYGIKDTAMSAFGGTHTDEDLWAQTALVRQMVTISPEQYRTWAERQGVTLATPREHEHGSQPNPAQRGDGHSHKH